MEYDLDTSCLFHQKNIPFSTARTMGMHRIKDSHLQRTPHLRLECLLRGLVGGRPDPAGVPPGGGGACVRHGVGASAHRRVPDGDAHHAAARLADPVYGVVPPRHADAGGEHVHPALRSMLTHARVVLKIAALWIFVFSTKTSVPYHV